VLLQVTGPFHRSSTAAERPFDRHGAGREVPSPFASMLVNEYATLVPDLPVPADLDFECD
jgi:hypothetical protein